MKQISCHCKRENMAFPLALASFGGIVLSLVLICTSRYIIGGPLLLLSIFFLKKAIFWFFNLKRHYEFDHDTGTVSMVTVEGKKQTVKQIALSSEIETFAVAGIRNWTKTRRWWTYHIVMILKNGKVYNITEPAGDKKHHEILKKATELAQIMDCPCFQSVHEQALEIKRLPGRVEVSNRDWKFTDNFRYNGGGILLSLALFAAILIFIIGLAVSL